VEVCKHPKALRSHGHSSLSLMRTSQDFIQISELILLSVKSTAKFSLTSTATEENHYMQNLSFLE